MELLGIWLMFVLAALLAANGVRLLVFCGYSRSFAQVMGVAVVIAAVFGIPLALSAQGGPWYGLAIIFSVAGFIVFGSFLGFCGATLWLGSRDLNDSWDYVIVLGAGLRQGRKPSLTLSSRLDRAADMLSRNPGGTIVVCGGQGSDEAIPESRAMRVYLEEHGVSPDRILEDDRSTTTYENLLFASRQIYLHRTGEEPSFLELLESPFGAQRILQVSDMNDGLGVLPKAVVVTSDFHVLRTFLLSMMVPGIAFTGFVGKPSRLYYLPLGLARDYVSLIVHLLRLALGKER